jgi:hypothetical protein
MSDDDFDDEDFEPRPLDREEATRVRRDLEDLYAFRQTFEPEGFKGVSVFCEDCVEEHFYGWKMLEENLTALLESGETPVHEPAFDPRPDEYVDWQYAQGYVDGLSDSEFTVLPSLDKVDGCPHCARPFPGDARDLTFCSSCGEHLGFARIAQALVQRGIPIEEVADLFRGARVPPLRGLPES